MSKNTSINQRFYSGPARFCKVGPALLLSLFAMSPSCAVKSSILLNELGVFSNLHLKTIYFSKVRPSLLLSVLAMPFFCAFKPSILLNEFEVFQPFTFT